MATLNVYKNMEAAMTRTLIGKRVEKLRHEHNLSRRQFGEIIGISEQYLRLVEKGLRGLSVDSIVRICNKMNASADYLLLGIDLSADVLDGLSQEQTEIIVDIIQKMVQFANTEDGNEVLIRQLTRQQRAAV